MKRRKPGPSCRPFVQHAPSSGHSGDAPADLDRTIKVPTRAKNGKTVMVEGTMTREQFYSR